MLLYLDKLEHVQLHLLIVVGVACYQLEAVGRFLKVQVVHQMLMERIHFMLMVIVDLEKMFKR